MSECGAHPRGGRETLTREHAQRVKGATREYVPDGRDVDALGAGSRTKSDAAGDVDRQPERGTARRQAVGGLTALCTPPRAGLARASWGDRAPPGGVTPGPGPALVRMGQPYGARETLCNGGASPG